MKKRTSRLLSVLLNLALVLGLLPSLTTPASAYSGAGTKNDPYVVTDYDELRELMRNVSEDDPVCYIELGRDITESGNQNSYYLYVQNGGNVVLDLAGYSLTRSALTTDSRLIGVQGGSLTINDSVGGGEIACKTKSGGYGYSGAGIFVESWSKSKLTVNGGTFVGGEYGIVTEGGTTVINGGTFLSLNPETTLAMTSTPGFFRMGTVIVNGGTFGDSASNSTTIDIKDADVTFYSCTAYYGMYSRNNSWPSLKGVTVTVDGTKSRPQGNYFMGNSVEGRIGAKIVISGPDKPIDTVEISGIDAPVTGQPLDFTADCDTIGVKSVSVYWYNLSDNKTVSKGEVAQAGKTYRVDVDLLPQAGYQFVGDKSEAVTINGEEAYIFGGTTDDLSVSYTFSETAAGKPVITKQPAAASGQVGSPMTFSVTATGATGYNWYIYDAGDAQAYSWSSIKQHATVSGESTSKITITPTDTWLNGKVLDCTIKGSGGFAYTDQAKMTVTAAPKTISTVAATGIDAPMIGSKPDTTAVAGSGNYTIAAVSWEPADSVFKDGTAYSVVVSLESKDGTKFAAAPVATINGQTARVVSGAGSQGLRISYTFPELEPGRINLTYDPSSVSTALGKTVTLSAFADIDFELTDNLKIQWYKVASNYYGTGTAIPGANDMAYTFKADKEETAYYYCEVSGRIMGEEYSSASDTAPMVWVTVAKAGTPVITTQPKSVSVKEGADVTFTVTAEGEGLSYQWYCEKNGGAAKVGTNGPTYTIKAANVPDDNGTVYYCVIHNKAGEATSEKATLTVSKLGAMTTFSDVPAGVWYTAAVDWAVEEEITNGTGGGKFSPTENCTHAQILTFLYRADRGVGTAAAEDMDKAVDWARGKGMIDASFNGAKECTRAEAVEYIWQALGKQDAKVSSFADVDAKAGYARAVDWAVDNGVTNGAGGGKFSPNTVCTRGHIVTFLHRAYVPEARV